MGRDTIAAMCDRLSALEPILTTEAQRVLYTEIISALRESPEVLMRGVTFGPVVDGSVEVFVDSADFNAHIKRIQHLFEKFIAELDRR